MSAKLSTHVLDTAQGKPAQGVRVELWSLDGPQPRLLKTLTTNADGRTSEPLLAAGEMRAGQYELVFSVGDYFANAGVTGHLLRFLDQVPVRFNISDTAASYHVPLLVSPWSYTIYRGS
jgi:5-hydroxyisourate hydrolase